MNNTTNAPKVHVEDLIPAPLAAGMKPIQVYGSLASYQSEDQIERPKPIDEDEWEESRARLIARTRARAAAAGLVNKRISASGGEPTAPGIEPEMVGTVRIYERDVVVTRRMIGMKTDSGGGGRRGEIKVLSPASKRRLSFAARNALGLTRMITLTYPGEFPLDGRLVKEHWRRIRQWLERRHVGGLWVLEFQKRGAPHLHVFTTRKVDRKELSAAWYKIVGSGDEAHLRAGTREEPLRERHAVACYAAKYVSKMEQKDVPEEFLHVGRFWGLFGGVKVVPKEQYSGFLVFVAPLIRALKAGDKVRRKRLGLARLKDCGRYRVTLWDGSATCPNGQLAVYADMLYGGCGSLVGLGTEVSCGGGCDPSGDCH